MNKKENIHLRMLHWDKFFEAGEEINVSNTEKINELLTYLEALQLRTMPLSNYDNSKNSESFSIIFSENKEEKLFVFINKDMDKIRIRFNGKQSRYYKINNGWIDIEFLRGYFKNNK